MKNLRNSLLELVKTTSTKLPADIIEALSKYALTEKEGTPARYAMDIIQDNIKLAVEKAQPICQDTGALLFFVKAPQGFDQADFMEQAKSAVIEATEKGYLRQNSVDPLTGKNSGNNLGPGSPCFHFEQSPSPQPSPQRGEGVATPSSPPGEGVEIRLILKGGGSENMGIQYSLPYAPLNAGRNIEGVKKCILDAVLKAQGKGCAPGVLGVTIGGDRGSGFIHSKEQLLRKLNDTNPNPLLSDVEKEIMEKANALGIGPMGFGGKTTLFGCKIGFLNRLPACYFVTITYVCWAYRRQGVVLDSSGVIKEWLY